MLSYLRTSTMESAMQDKKSSTSIANRTTAFCLNTLKMLREVPPGVEFKHIRRQLTHSSADVGMHFRDVDRAELRCEFIAGLAEIRKSLAESEYWIGLIEGLKPDVPGIGAVHAEARSLMELFERIRQRAEAGAVKDKVPV